MMPGVPHWRMGVCIHPARATSLLPPPAPQGRILLSVTEPAGHNSHHAEVCGICTTSDPAEDGQFTGFNLMATQTVKHTTKE